jgi:hypothetical protein
VGVLSISLFTCVAFSAKRASARKRFSLSGFQSFAVLMPNAPSGYKKPLASLDWRTGPLEGHVNRLQLIKRSMYGRAKFDLLRLRVLYHPAARKTSKGEQALAAAASRVKKPKTVEKSFNSQ